MFENNALVWLSEQQAKLDAYIFANNNLTLNQDLLNKKIVAFIVELGEYANEERSFKYWSKKQPAHLSTQLDEYIDGLHFLISLGNNLQFDFANSKTTLWPCCNNVDAYLGIVKALAAFIEKNDLDNYQRLLNGYLTIAKLCNYSQAQLLVAYKAKNKINFERQDKNY